MGEKENREKLVSVAKSYMGASRGSTKHKNIIDAFNQIRPDGWAMTYTAPWCAAFASACAIKTFGIEKARKYFPLSANCGTIISLAKKMGIWVEKDSYMPKVGDWILYDWGDNGKGDNTGSPDHVGIVKSADKEIIVVIEGNKGLSESVGTRVIAYNGRYIRGFVTPNYGFATPGQPKVSSDPKWKGTITRNGAGVRTWAGKKNPKIKTYPTLKKGTVVEVCDTVKSPAKNNWYYVRINKKIYGFVYSGFVKKK